MLTISRKTLMLLLLLIPVLMLAGCSPSPAESDSDLPNDHETGALQETIAAQEEIIEELTAEKEALEDQVNSLENQLSQASSGSMLMAALTLVEQIADQDFEAVAQFVDPDEGVLFSPYGYVDVNEDLVFFPQDLETAFQDATVYTWGAFDGTGDPIDKTFAEYYDRFIYDQDYASPHLIGNNTIVGTGNTLINLEDVYPDAGFVEFHFTGFDPQYEGMDWRSLRLVLEEQNGSWVLRAIVHDEWTI